MPYEQAKPCKWLGRIGQGLGYLTLAYSSYNFATDQSWSNGVELGVAIGSMAFWEVGAVYYGEKSFYGLARTTLIIL